jgi:hypothetical protein
MRYSFRVPLDHYITLGRSGLRVSPFRLGAMAFGEGWGEGATVAESEAMLAAFMERGGNVSETENKHARGHPEEIIGDELKQILTAFDEALDADDMSALDRVSAPTHAFRHIFLANANMIMHGGATITGEPSARWPMRPATAADRY